MDLAFAVPLAIVALPICLALMVLIRLESPGAPLFVQERVGRGKKPFKIYKLRTMVEGTPDIASHHANSVSITLLGRALRRLKLDELPQLLNVIAGSMSLIGPRPCLYSQTELIAERDKRNLYALRPGVTGPGQLRGIDMSTPALLAEIEAQYFASHSVVRDLDLLFRTVLGGGTGDAVKVDGRA